MMWWYDGAGSWWAWLLMSVGMVAFWGLVIWAVVAVVRSAGTGVTGSASGDPERILAERFARGEIDADEYDRRRAILRDGRRAA